MRKFWTSISRNSRICLAVEPLWALFGPATFFFGPLYMKDIGLSELEMGLINSLATAASFVFFTLSGPITNKLGRKKTTLYFDFLAWPVAMVLWGMASGFWWFLVAAILNSLVRIVQVSWNLLLVEDSAPEHRVTIFGICGILGGIGGFVTMGTGFLRDSLGLIPVMRTLYLVGAVSMSAMIIIRHALCRETANGVAMMERFRHHSLLRAARVQLAHFFEASRDRQFINIAALYTLMNASQAFSFFQILYLKNHLHYGERDIALIPGINALLIILLLVLVLPRLPQRGERRGLVLSFLGSALASLLFVALPSGNLILALFINALAAAAFQILAAFREAVFMNHSSEEQRAGLYGLVQTLAMLFTIPAGWLAGWFYTLNPVAPFVANACIFTAGLLISLGIRQPDPAPEVVAATIPQ